MPAVAVVAIAYWLNFVVGPDYNAGGELFKSERRIEHNWHWYPPGTTAFRGLVGQIDYPGMDHHTVKYRTFTNT